MRVDDDRLAAAQQRHRNRFAGRRLRIPVARTLLDGEGTRIENVAGARSRGTRRCKFDDLEMIGRYPARYANPRPCRGALKTGSHRRDKHQRNNSAKKSHDVPWLHRGLFDAWASRALRSRLYATAVRRRTS
jgi:hypothetical protein